MLDLIEDMDIFEDIEAIAKDLTKERAKLLAVLEKLREGTVMNGDDMGFSVV